MHSKSFTVDNQATIVGGRNIGDEYFDADENLAFADIDVLAVGPVVPKVSVAFDEYWNSEHAYPVTTLTAPAEPEALPALHAQLENFYREDAAKRYISALTESKLARGLRAGTVAFDWARAQVIYDSPNKKERGDNRQKELLISQLAPYLQATTKELLIISP